MNFAFLIAVPLILRVHSLMEWNSSEVIFTNYINYSNPLPLTPPPWLDWYRHFRKPRGEKTHRHLYFDADGFQHLITYSNYFKRPDYIYYIRKAEVIHFDPPLRKWLGGGKHHIHSYESTERRYYYINNTATTKSVWVSPLGQQDEYFSWWKDYRGTWIYNDSMIFAYVNDTARQIPPKYMVRKLKQRGSILGRWDVLFPPPSRAFWHGQPENAGLLLHEYGRETFKAGNTTFYLTKLSKIF